MKVLGIDTIFHDICAAVMEDNKVLSNEKRSTPMFAVSQSLLDIVMLHIQEIGETLRETLQKADVRMEDISLIAVNNEGSFLSSALIGLVTANVLSSLEDIPIIDISHQEGHIFSNWIERNPAEFIFPILVFSASGGHSLIALVSRDDFRYDTLIETKGIIKEISKSAAEFTGLGFLFSKVVIELGLVGAKERAYGDGNFISQLAAKGHANRFDFFLNQKKDNFMTSMDFKELLEKVRRMIKKEKRWKKGLPDELVFDIAASFQEALAEGVSAKLLLMAEKYKAKEIHLTGGVSANEAIRTKLAEKAKRAGMISRFPKEKSYCTDNAAMIANVGYYKFIKDPEKYIKQRHLPIKSDLVLERLAIDQFIKQNKKLD